MAHLQGGGNSTDKAGDSNVAGEGGIKVPFIDNIFRSVVHDRGSPPCSLPMAYPGRMFRLRSSGRYGVPPGSAGKGRKSLVATGKLTWVSRPDNVTIYGLENAILNASIQGKEPCNLMKRQITVALYCCITVVYDVAVCRPNPGHRASATMRVSLLCSLPLRLTSSVLGTGSIRRIKLQ